MSQRSMKIAAIPPARPLSRSELGPGFAVVMDAAPLIWLAKARLLQHLAEMFHLGRTKRMLIITQSVWNEAMTSGTEEFQDIRDWLLISKKSFISPVVTFLDQERDRQWERSPLVYHHQKGEGEKASLEMLEDTSFPDALFVCDDRRGRNEAKRRNRRVMGVRSFAEVMSVLDPTCEAQRAILGIPDERNIKTWPNDSPLV